MKAMNDVCIELNEEQISRVSIPDKKMLDCSLLLNSYFNAWVTHKQTSDWLKIKGIVLEDKFIIRHYCFPSEKLWRVI